MTVKNRSWLQKHPKQVWGIIVTLMTIIGFLTRVPVIKDGFDWFINTSTLMKNTQSGSVVVASRPVFFTVFLLLFFFIVIAFILLIGEIRARKSIGETLPTIDLKVASDENRERQDILNNIKVASAAIKDRSFPTGERPLHKLLKIQYTYFIHKNWTGEVRRYQEILANDKPVPFYVADIGVSGKAKPVVGISPLSIRIADEAPRETTFLPLELDTNHKSLLIFFLPRIEPTESSPRKLLIEYIWPEMFNEVKLDNQERLSWTLESAAEITSLDFEVFFEPGIEVGLECVIVGPTYAGGNIVGAYDQNRGWHGYRYSVHGGPAGRSTYELLVKQRNSS